jgi:hypothetical protein
MYKGSSDLPMDATSVILDNLFDISHYIGLTECIKLMQALKIFI